SGRVTALIPSPRSTPLTASPSINSPSGASKTYLIPPAGVPSSNLIEPRTMTVPGSAGTMQNFAGVGDGQFRVAKQLCVPGLPGPRHQVLLTAPGAGRL